MIYTLNYDNNTSDLSDPNTYEGKLEEQSFDGEIFFQHSGYIFFLRLPTPRTKRTRGPATELTPYNGPYRVRNITHLVNIWTVRPD